MVYSIPFYYLFLSPSCLPLNNAVAMPELKMLQIRIRFVPFVADFSDDWFRLPYGVAGLFYFLGICLRLSCFNQRIKVSLRC